MDKKNKYLELMEEAKNFSNKREHEKISQYEF